MKTINILENSTQVLNLNAYSKVVMYLVGDLGGATCNLQCHSNDLGNIDLNTPKVISFGSNAPIKLVTSGGTAINLKLYVYPVTSRSLDEFGQLNPELYYLFDGSTSYMEFPNINLVLGDSLEFDLISPNAPSTINEYIFDSLVNNVNRCNFYVDSLNRFRIPSSIEVFLDGNQINNITSTMPVDGLIHSYTVSAISDANIGRFGAAVNKAGIGTFGISNLKVISSLDNRNYPMNTVSDVIIDTISGQNGNIIGYNANGWKT